jgi:hypothetical protein
MKTAAAILLFLMTRVAVAGFLLGPELPLDRKGAADVASLLTPDLPFAIFRQSRAVTLISMRDRGHETAIPCAGFLPDDPMGSHAVVGVGSKGALFVCYESPLAAHFVAIDGSVSDPILLPVPFGPRNLTWPLVYWTGRDFAVFLTQDLRTLWYLRFSADGALVTAPQVLVPTAHEWVLISGVAETSIGPLLFVREFSFSFGFPGFSTAFALRDDAASQTGMISPSRDLEVASDRAGHLLAAWWAYEGTPDGLLEMTRLSELDPNGNAMNSEEFCLQTKLSVGWDGSEFILVTPEAHIAAIKDATEMPHFTAPVSGASYAYVLSANGRAVIIYSAMRDGAQSTFYRWIEEPRRRSAR